MTDRTWGRITPVGSRESLKVLPPATTVCPAFAPPLYRTTKSNWSPKRSTIFPLASSPHRNPTTHVPAISVLSGQSPGRGGWSPDPPRKNARGTNPGGSVRDTPNHGSPRRWGRQVWRSCRANPDREGGGGHPTPSLTVGVRPEPVARIRANLRLPCVFFR